MLACSYQYKRTLKTRADTMLPMMIVAAMMLTKSDICTAPHDQVSLEIKGFGYSMNTGCEGHKEGEDDVNSLISTFAWLLTLERYRLNIPYSRGGAERSIISAGFSPNPCEVLAAASAKSSAEALLPIKRADSGSCKAFCEDQQQVVGRSA